MAVETVPWNQCLLCILRLRRPPTSSSRPSRFGRAPLPFPLRSLLSVEAIAEATASLRFGSSRSGFPSLVARPPRAVLPGFPPPRGGTCSRPFGPTSFIVSTRDAPSRGSSPPRSPRRPRSSACVRGAVRPRCRLRQPCVPPAKPGPVSRSPCTEVLGSTVLRGPCRARPPRSSRALGHDELGHPGLAAASGGRLRFRVGAAPAVTPVPVRPTSTTHDSFDKERELPTSWCTPFASHATGSARYTPSISPRRAGSDLARRCLPRAQTRAYLGRFVIEASRAPHVVRHSRDPGPPAERCPPASAQGRSM